MKVLIGIQARSKSKRFPNKITAQFLDKPILLWVYEAATRVNMMRRIATVETIILLPAGDDEAREFCASQKMASFAPEDVDENDLVGRYMAAREHFEAETIVRLTGDCPLVPTRLIEQCIAKMTNVDYCSNTIVRTYPEGWDVQACSHNALKWFDEQQQELREHPFHPFEQNEQIRAEFINAGYTLDLLVDRASPIFRKLSIDTPQDLERLEGAYREESKRAK